MRTKQHSILAGAGVAVLLLSTAAGLGAKEKTSPTDPNDPTHRLFALLDEKYNGKLDDFCVLADLIPDPTSAGQQLQRVIEVDYGKARVFGKLNIHVRTVATLTPDQLKAYSPKQIFDFAESDAAKFIKTDAGYFGRPGDVYFEAPPSGGALSSAPVTSQVQSEYENLITQYLIPAVEKKTP